MELVYAYIPDYKAIKEGEFHFDPRFAIHFDKESHSLSIKSQNPLPANFWGDDISSITAIVGENGAGKSTLIRWILEKLSNSYSGIDPRTKEVFIIILQKKNNELYIYQSNNLVIHEIEYDDHTYNRPFGNDKHGFKVLDHEYCESLPTIFLQQSTIAYQANGGFFDSLYFHNISDEFIIRDDYRRYYKHSSFKTSVNLHDLSVAHYIENATRILTFLTFGIYFTAQSLDNIKDHKEASILNHTHLPDLIIIQDNCSGYEQIRNSNGIRIKPNQRDSLHISFNEISELIKERPTALLDSNNCITPEHVLEIFIDNFIWNLIASFPNSFKEYIDFINGWHEYNTSRKNYINDFSNYYRNSAQYRNPIFEQFISFIKRLPAICKFNFQIGFFIHTSEISSIKEFIDSFLTPGMISHSIRYFDMRYAHYGEDGIIETSELSNGEYQILNLLSRLFYIYHTLPKINPDSMPPELIILDEGENSFHPDWQRRYIKTLVNFFHTISSHKLITLPERIEEFTLPKFQIIYTTHSPITLSDMPGCCVNYISREGDKTMVKRGGVSDRMETFGANVFDLYRDSFFMHHGLVGSFASQKIKETVEFISGNGGNNNKKDHPHFIEPTKENLLKIINLIGDPRIKQYISELFHRKYGYKDEEISNLKREIEDLKAKLRKANSKE